MGRISCLSNRGNADWMGYSCMCQESYPLGRKTLIVVCQSSTVVHWLSRSDAQPLLSVANEPRVLGGKQRLKVGQLD